MQTVSTRRKFRGRRRLVRVARETRIASFIRVHRSAASKSRAFHDPRRVARERAACLVTPPTLDFVRSLAKREVRERTGRYAVEGVKFLVSAVDARTPIEGLVVCPALLTSAIGQMLVRRLRRSGVPELRVDATTFGHVAHLRDGTGRGVIAVARARWCERVSLGPRDLWLAVEGARSPGNLGTLLRTCLAVGARGAFVLGDGDPYDPGCVRATMGALHALEIARTTPAALAAIARRDGARVIGAALDGALDFRAPSYRGPTVLVLGSERSGLTAEMRRACDVLVRIPMVGPLDSLNLAVAGSLLLYEAFGQRSPRQQQGGRGLPGGGR
jgi:TrmH family RNA methyltransferase